MMGWAVTAVNQWSSLVNHFGEPLWSTTLVNHFGQPVWWTSLVNHFGQPVWWTTLVTQFGEPLWSTTSDFGSPFQFTILVNHFGDWHCKLPNQFDSALNHGGDTCSTSYAVTQWTQLLWFQWERTKRERLMNVNYFTTCSQGESLWRCCYFVSRVHKKSNRREGKSM